MDKIVKECGICRGNRLEVLWELPRLPFTERFGTYTPELADGADQSLLICVDCGHVQLGKQISPELLYDASYSFRTGQSATATQGSAVFLDFLDRCSRGRRFRSALDIGGNDQYLARQIKGRAENVYVIDPVCAHLDGKTVDGVRIIGRFIETVHLSKDIEPPDLVICRHTLEHISDPNKVLAQALSQCREDALFVFEIPCLEGLAEGIRFDAVFHQHLHYFDLEGLQRLVSANGGRWLGHYYNQQGSCGGALLFAFSSARENGRSAGVDAKAHTKAARIRRRLDLFQAQMAVSSELLASIGRPLFGYGASLMLATLAYHLKTDLSPLECILDDDPAKHDLGYANLRVRVSHTQRTEIPENAFFLITSLENTRPIHKRIMELKPRRILMPIPI